MKIPHELTPLAYNISRQVYEGQLTLSEGKKQLVGANLMNPNSAADYINNFKYLLEGVRFTRTLNAFSMEYFFENIYNDFGTEKLSSALNALKAHIEYYEGMQKVRMHKMRDVYEKYFGAIPIISPDEKEQNEIIEKITKDPLSKQDLLKLLLNPPDQEDLLVIVKGKAYKRYNRTIAQIKILRDFKCQICNTTIVKKDGNNYIEAAHISPKNQRGRETLDNIILLCPNHHKEFDYGNRVVINHSKTNVEFSINGIPYNLNFIPDLT